MRRTGGKILTPRLRSGCPEQRRRAGLFLRVLSVLCGNCLVILSTNILTGPVQTRSSASVRGLQVLNRQEPSYLPGASLAAEQIRNSVTRPRTDFRHDADVLRSGRSVRRRARSVNVLPEIEPCRSKRAGPELNLRNGGIDSHPLHRPETRGSRHLRAAMRAPTSSRRPLISSTRQGRQLSEPTRRRDREYRRPRGDRLPSRAVLSARVRVASGRSENAPGR